ncbi:SDR family oxidoreductase [Tepidamorphus sp. 3E244]|uniref:SDR family oxidoreductase n=1 Tax=Tepidamorphus sp. 3E244 TaxID=3385498 RepID=UPI0038FC0632
MGNPGRLASKAALVTGAASGFGKAIAETYAREGARVAVVDIDSDGAKRVASEIDGAIAVTCDVSKRADVDAAVAAMLEAFGQLDVLVNNAGWCYRNQPSLDVDEDAYDRVFDVNVKSIYHFTHAAVPHWRASGGGVMINIGSTAGIRPRPGLTWYNASKAAVNLMSRSLAVELAPDMIRVNAIAPVLGETALMETFMGVPDTPENREKFMATIPLGRFSKPADIANAALYLASDEAEFLTGVVLEVDGGRTI